MNTLISITLVTSVLVHAFPTQGRCS